MCMYSIEKEWRVCDTTRWQGMLCAHKSAVLNTKITHKLSKINKTQNIKSKTTKLMS